MNQNWLFSQDGRRAAKDTEKVKRYVRDNFGMCLLDGIPDEPLVTPRALKQEGDIASFLNVGIGYRIAHEKYSCLSWNTEKVPEDVRQEKVVFVFCFGYGDGAAYPQPMGWYDLYLNQAKILSFRAVKYSQIFEGSECRLALRVVRACFAAKDQILYLDRFTNGDSWTAFGSAALEIPTSKLIPGRSAQIKIQARSFFPSKRWLRIDMTGRFWKGRLLNELNSIDIVRILKHKRKVPFLEGSNFYFGDLHAHSDCGSKAVCGYNSLDQVKSRNCSGCTLTRGGSGCGYGTIIQNYHFARTVANLDFFCLAEHGFQMYGEQDWNLRLNLAKDLSTEGEFVWVPGYEFTSEEQGHRNIYFSEYKGRMIPCFSRIQDIEYNNLDPRQLWKPLEDDGVPFFSVPHHPPVICHAFDWASFNEKYDRLVEVFSGWGDHWDVEGYLRGHGSDKAPELSVKRAFENNFHFGIIASSDSHDGCPGAAQAQPSNNWSNKYSRSGSGLAVVQVDRLTLKNIFKALYMRRCYATTGIHTLIDFRVNGHSMGSDVKMVKNKINLELSVGSPLNITKIRIFKNGELKKRVFCDSKDELLALNDHLKEKGTANYIVIVDFQGHERAWSSPVRVTRG